MELLCKINTVTNKSHENYLIINTSYINKFLSFVFQKEEFKKKTMSPKTLVYCERSLKFVKSFFSPPPQWANLSYSRIDIASKLLNLETGDWVQGCFIAFQARQRDTRENKLLGSITCVCASFRPSPQSSATPNGRIL